MVNSRRGKTKVQIVTSAPVAADLDIGEIVFCTADDKLYIKDETNAVIKTAALT